MGSSRLTDTEIAEMETANDTQQAVNLGVTLNITYLFESVRLPPRRCQGLDAVAERLSEVTGVSGLEPVGSGFLQNSSVFIKCCPPTALLSPPNQADI